MMDRRKFIGAAAGAILATPVVLHAQPAQKVYRIGWLSVGRMPLHQPFWDAMRGLGWVEGQNLKIERRAAAQRGDLPAFAAELAQIKVDLIMTYGSPAAGFARNATTTIPIVFFVGADPVRNGLVASLARPGGNLTGVLGGLYEEKRLQILKEALPGVARVAYPTLGEPDEDVARAAKALGIQAQDIALKSPFDFGPFFSDAKKAGVDAVLVADIATLVPQMERMGAEALSNRLPAIGFKRSFAESGGLLYYGPVPNYESLYLAAQVDKILKGAKPADLPVQQPTRFELVINMKTAQSLGIMIPQSLLIRADEAIR